MIAARLALVMILLGGMMSGASGAMTLEDFEKPLAWEFYDGREFPGASGAFRVQKKAAHSGKQGGTLAFDFTKGGAYVQTGIALPKEGDISAVRLWIRKSCPNRLGVRVTDSEGQTFQKTFHVPVTGWQEVEIAFDGWTGFWGGKADGIFRGRPAQFALLVQNDGAAKRGEVYFDDLRIVAGKAASGMHDVTYTESTFDPAEGWSLRVDGDAGDSFLTGRDLHLDFRRGASAIGIGNERALMGTAAKLHLRVESNVKAPVRMRIYSHFQVFEKTIGELNGLGEQTFEVPLGDMNEWSHWGGENDGVPRWPLRVGQISVVRTEGVETGDVRFLEMKVTSHITPDQQVMMIPTGSMEGAKCRFACEMRNTWPEKSSGVLSWTIRDYSGGILERKSKPTELQPDSSLIREISFDAGGRPYVECEFRYTANGRTFGPVTTSAVAPLPDKGSDALQPESMYGMGVYLYRYPNTPNGLAMMDRAAAMAQAAGVKWSREEFSWSRIEPERGKYSWDFYDKVVETARRHGISVYGLIAYWSPWTKPFTAEGIADYAGYCRALVSRYKDRIKHWEVWNEPNIFFWAGPKEQYPELLKEAYRAIKEEDPEAHVLGCSTAGIDTAFIEMVQNAGAPYDILTIHPYRGTLDDEGFMRELQDVRKLTAKADGKPKPVWITEMGWPTQLPDGVSERDQAGLLARSYLCAAASGAAENVSWYDFREDGTCPFYNEHHFGVVKHADFSPKPGYRALATVCRTLGGQKLDHKLNLGNGVFAYRFAGQTEDVIAIWTADRAALLSLDLKSKSPVVLRDLMGNESTIAGSRTLISIRPNSPVFLIARGLEVSAERSPITIESQGGVHPGEKAIVRLSSAIPGARVSLEVPQGWKVGRRSDGAFEAGVPASAKAGTEEATLVVRTGSRTLRLPVLVRVVPLLLRV